jgi:hypothetical protein
VEDEFKSLCGPSKNKRSKINADAEIIINNDKLINVFTKKNVIIMFIVP